MDKKLADKVSGMFVAQIDPRELAVVLLEAAGQMKRPEGLTAVQAFSGIDREDQEQWHRAAVAGLNFFSQKIAEAQKPN